MRLKRILTGLDFSLADRALLATNAFLCTHLSVEKCYFVHVTDHLVRPQHLRAHFARLFAPDMPVDEVLRKRLESKILDNGLDEIFPEWEIDILEGQPEQQLLHWIEVKQPDLVLMGNKLEAGSGGVLPRRLARRTTAEVVFVPETFIRPIRHLLVAIDFSENAAHALRRALAFAKNLPQARVEPLYVVELPPSGFYLNEQELEAYNEMVKATARQTWEAFAAAFGFDQEALDCTFKDNHYMSTAQAITDYATESGADLLMIGARGHSAIEVLLFGSVTERVLDHCKDLPVWVVRPPKD